MQIPGTAYVEFNERLVPTGAILNVGRHAWDYRRFREIGCRRFNHCYVRLERDVNKEWPRHPCVIRHHRTGNRRDDGSVFFGSGGIYRRCHRRAPRASIAIEPMTCASDAFNHPDWGLKRLAPGETSLDVITSGIEVHLYRAHATS